MKKIFILLFPVLLFSACSTVYYLEDKALPEPEYIAEPEPIEPEEPIVQPEYIPHEPEFITLINGTRVDTRVDMDVVDLLFRHFNAVEDGDIVAFRETLQGQDGASMNWHASLILANFWDIVVGDYEDEMFWGDSDIDLTTEGWHRVFFETFPPANRNTGLFITEIGIHDDWAIKVATNNNNGKQSFYTIGLLSDFGFPGVEWRWTTDPWDVPPPPLSAYHANIFAAVANSEIPFMFFNWPTQFHVDWVIGNQLAWTNSTTMLFYDYLNSPGEIYAGAERFAFVDMDGSGVPALVFSCWSDGDRLILRYVGDGAVHGFGIPARQFQSLKTDGTFLQLSWMQDWGSIARFDFSGEHATLHFLYEWDQYLSHEGLLYVNGEWLDFDDGWAMVEAAREYHHSKEPVQWHLWRNN